MHLVSITGTLAVHVATSQYFVNMSLIATHLYTYPIRIYTMSAILLSEINYSVAPLVEIERGLLIAVVLLSRNRTAHIFLRIVALHHSVHVI